MKLSLTLLTALLLASLAELHAADETKPAPDRPSAVWKGAALTLNCARVHDMSCKEAAGEYSVSTSGNDAFIFAANLVAAYNPARGYVLALDYKTDADTGLNAYYQSGGTTHYVPIVQLKKSAEWTTLWFDLTLDGNSRGAMEWFRLGFRGGPDAKHISLKNVRLLEANDELRVRVALGATTGLLPTFGIHIGGLKPKYSARETVRLSTKESTNIVASLYPPLDMDVLTKDMRNDPSAAALVPLAPALVCGEGEHIDNHTVVRILSPYQVVETQFLAYPPEITGGVGVAALKRADNRPHFAAWPLASDQTTDIRVFNHAGGLEGSINVAKTVPPPFTVCAGKFVPGLDGEQLAVTSRRSTGPAPAIMIYSAEGTLLKEIPAPSNSGGECALAVKRFGATDMLLVQYPERHTYFSMNADGVFSPVPFQPTSTMKLFPSVYEDRAWNAGGAEKIVSTLYRVDAQGRPQPLDAGRMENIFWFCKQPEHGGETAGWGVIPDGKYVKNGMYNFLGEAMGRSSLPAKGDIENKTYAEWVGGINWYETANLPPKNLNKHRRQIGQYDTGEPAVWALMFTHRWNLRAMNNLMLPKDPATGLPRYLALDRANKSHDSGYFGKPLFTYGSQNFEQESLTAFYHNVQRDFYKRLAPRYRANPEQAIAVEPSHENEIVSGPRSVGDYNPKSIEDFYQYLLGLYGDVSAINRVFGTTFTESFFDAPRGLFRGKWDAYSPQNPFFEAWVEYGRTVVYRHVALAQRETLLAGFPPELIKSHQIPDTFAVNNIGTGDGEPRITPIDWFFTAGTGFGFSRYGTDYKKPRNIHLAAHSSGFDGMLIGEYASLTPSKEDAYEQLLYLRSHGVASLHVMWWPTYMKGGAESNVSQEAALHRLVKESDIPRPGYAGGIGEVRPYKGKAAAFDIAELGVQAENTGLIKSLRADGSFEGTVYVTPFHAHVAVTTLKSAPTFTVPVEGTNVCELPPLRAGSVIELTGVTSGSIDEMVVSLTHQSLPLKGSAVVLTHLPTHHVVRIVYKVPLNLDNVALHLTSRTEACTLTDVKVYLHQDQSISLTRNIQDGNRNKGGVTFDVLE
ncbi:MAG: hypothetical protein WCT04_08495 [Planctomycetota bacterium]